MITAAHLQAAGVQDPATWVQPVTDACALFKINTQPQIAAFLAQTAHESAGYTRLVENLNYSAEALQKIWPKRFPTLDFAKTFHRNPEKIANTVYADRMGNGAPASGDGWRYRGRGLKQLTGRDNYRHCSSSLGVDIEAAPDLLLQPKYAALSAGWFWSVNGCGALADAGEFERLTKRINGGLIGLADRKARHDRVLAVMESGHASQETSA